MYAVTVLFHLKPGKMDDFLPRMVENARTSLRDEPGCLLFDVCSDPAASAVFLYEVYDSRAGFDAHLASAHFRAFDTSVAELVAGKTVRCFDEVLR